MTKAKQETFQITVPTDPDFRRDSRLAHSIAALMRHREVTREEVQLGRQLRISATEQTAVVLRAEYASDLSSKFTERTYVRIDGVVRSARTVREKERDEADQSVMEKVCDHLLESEVNTQLALRQTVVNELGRICTEPFDRNVAPQEEVIVEQTPGFFGRLFGGQTVTRVQR